MNNKLLRRTHLILAVYISFPTDPSPTTHLVLVRDSIGDQLESIIRARRVTARTLTDQPTHIIRRLPLRLIQHKSISEVLDSLWLKARQPTIQHQLNNMTQVIAMLATRKKCLEVSTATTRDSCSSSSRHLPESRKSSVNTVRRRARSPRRARW